MSASRQVDTPVLSPTEAWQVARRGGYTLWWPGEHKSPARKPSSMRGARTAAYSRGCALRRPAPYRTRIAFPFDDQGPLARGTGGRSNSRSTAFSCLVSRSRSAVRTT
jgi:hypothetical protein